jgi:K+-sensing histidine kinase KdpD
MAHNLNNLLTPLLMGIDMPRHEEDPEERADALDRMSGAAGSAREFVRQVLTRRRAVRPFFTTRPLSQGDGLGLAMVHGIVSAAGGALLLESAPGAGTTVRVYLPRAG